MKTLGKRTTQTVAEQLHAALWHWEKKYPVKGGKVDLTVSRRDLGRRKGWAIRVLAGSQIIVEWRCDGSETAEKRYLEVMRALASLSGFRGITGTSSDEETVTGAMLGKE